jgi:DNA helicase-2/ATP-dependent DNA helicase PcrA
MACRWAKTTALRSLLPDTLDVDTFTSLPVLRAPPPSNEAARPKNVCDVIHLERSLSFAMGTVAGMKGETHVASLVLESYGGRSRRFDIETALPVISGIESGFKKLSKLQQEQMRNLYVAMSRPTKLLCLAANEERVPQPVIDALEVKGWIIERVT